MQQGNAASVLGSLGMVSPVFWGLVILSCFVL